jgi:3-methylcrotonyl-CoA carboxylase beta subunit
MGGEQAASVLATLRRDALEGEGRQWSREEEETFKMPIRAKYETEGSPYYATARLWDDGIVTPQETRRVLSLAFSSTLNTPAEPTHFGVFRM